MLGIRRFWNLGESDPIQPVDRLLAKRRELDQAIDRAGASAFPIITSGEASRASFAGVANEDLPKPAGYTVAVESGTIALALSTMPDGTPMFFVGADQQGVDADAQIVHKYGFDRFGHM